MIKQKNQGKNKNSLCRYYLRGLCKQSIQRCEFAHGVKDLSYSKFQIDENVETNHLAEVEFNQNPRKKNIIKNYINLYEFAQQVGFYLSLEELNTQREKRLTVRKHFHEKQLRLFLELLECIYPNAIYTKEFITREYYRVGFNKLMTRIKQSHFIDYMVEKQGYYSSSLTIPPHSFKKRVFFLQKANTQQIFWFYKNKTLQFYNQCGQTPSEEEIKHFLQDTMRNWQLIPSFSEYLKSQSMSFQQFLAYVGVSTFSEEEKVIEEISYFLRDQLIKKGYAFKSEVEEYLELIKKAKYNDLIYDAIEKCELLLLKFINFYLITSVTYLYQYPFEEVKCGCSLKKVAKETHEVNKDNFEGKLHPKPIIIDSMESLLTHRSDLLNSKQLGVDLQGPLHKDGCITMMQLNNQKNIYLIDCLTVNQSKDEKLIDCMKETIHQLMINPSITKVLHDCRQDSVGLHQLLGTCINNIMDTSAMQTLFNNIELYKKHGYKFVKKLTLPKLKDFKYASLNYILNRWHAPSGQNKLKKEFGQMWENGTDIYSNVRPLQQKWIDYCVMDVLDLLVIKDNMKVGMNPHLIRLVSKQYSIPL